MCTFNYKYVKVLYILAKINEFRQHAGRKFGFGEENRNIYQNKWKQVRMSILTDTLGGRPHKCKILSKLMSYNFFLM